MNSVCSGCVARPGTGWVRAAAVTLVSVAMLSPVPAARLDSKTAAEGLKEALQVGTGNAVNLLGQADGYLGNPEVRIPVPDSFERLGKGLRALGMDDLIDDFETSMNRAAEAAAPLARDVFVETIKEMSFADAMAIVRGQGHEATDYLRQNAGPTLAERFRPIVVTQLDEVGATRAFGRLMGKAENLPFVDKPAFELDRYVTDEALDGMFMMIAREEEKIRKDPLARTSDLLRRVFGGEDDGPKKKRRWWKRILGDDD